MDAEQRRALLHCARSALASELTGAAADESSLDFPMEFDGLFVTLRVQGRLRGCVGTFRAARHT